MPVHVVVESSKNVQQSVRARDHQWIVDEPRESGGDDAGPDPYDQLLAALGSCSAIALKLFARRKGWPLERVRIELSHHRIHAEDCEGCETKTGKVDRIEKAIYVQGALSTEQVNALLAVARSCPVHQTLTSENQIVEEIHLEESSPGS